MTQLHGWLKPGKPPFFVSVRTNADMNVCNPASSNSVTPDYWSLSGDCESQGLVTATFFLLYNLVGLPWNVLVILSILNKKLYQQPTIVLLFILSVTDILSLFSILPIMITGFAREYLFGSTDLVRCVTLNLVISNSNVLLHSSILIIALMSLDRFLYVYKPLQYERLATPRKMLLAVIPIVLLWIFITLVVYFFPVKVIFEPSKLASKLEFTSCVIIMLLTLANLIFVFTVVCNILFSWIACKNFRKIYTHGSSMGTDMKSHLYCFQNCVSTTSNQKQNQISRVVCCFIIPSFVFWLLHIASWIVYILGPDDFNDCGLVPFLLILYFCPTVIHPIIETWLIPDVRNSLKKMVMGRLKLNRAIPVMKICVPEVTKHL